MTYNDEKRKAKSSVKLQEFGNRIFSVAPVVPDSLARELVSFELTVDSVVATATITYESSHRFITIFWGDSDEGETFDTLKIKSLIPALGGPQLPENTIRVQHVYEEPEPPARTSNYLFYIVLQENDGSRSFGPAQRILMEPRYQFNIYGVTLEFNSHLDSSLEQVTEISIDMMVTHGDNKLIDKHWDPDVYTNSNIGPLPGEERFPVYFELTDSRLSHEILLGSPDGIFINFVTSERENIAKDIWEYIVAVKDFFVIEFDGSTEIFDDGAPRGIHPARLTNRGVKTYNVELEVQDGYFDANIKTEMKLIVPIDKTTGLLIKA